MDSQASDSALVNKDLIIGVDPGIKGAVGVINVDTMKAQSLPIPTYSFKGKNHIDCKELSSILSIFAPKTLISVVERPSAMPNQGVSSTFRFGKACGLVEGILHGLEIDVITVPPATWKAYLGLSSNKSESAILASDLFPSAKHLWKLKKHNDLAESVLLAYYGLQMLRENYKKFTVKNT